MNPLSPSPLGWVPKPDQSGYAPLRRSIRTVDLSRPPVQDPPDADPDGCHRSLSGHQKAHRSRLKRQVENELDAEEASLQSSRNDLKPDPWRVQGEHQLRLPNLRRTMEEIGNDPVRAWERFDTRTDEEKTSEVKRKLVRRDVVTSRVEEMLRLEREEKEERDVEQLLHEIPMYEFPQLNNTVQFSALIRAIQENLGAPVKHISLINTQDPSEQLYLRQVLSWVQEDCAEQDLERVFLFSKAQFDNYCGVLADKVFHHLSADFRKHTYLHQLRRAEAQLRVARQSIVSLRKDNESLRFGIPQRAAETTSFQGHGNRHQRQTYNLEPIAPPSVLRQHYQPSYEDTKDSLFTPPLTEKQEPPLASSYLNTDATMRDGHRMKGRNRRFQNHFRPHQDKGLPDYRHSTSRNASEALPEMDPITGYGTVVAVDEVGPIFEYSKLEDVTMRGGGPYDFLDEDDDDDDDLMSLKTGISQKIAKFKSQDYDDDTPSIYDDHKSIVSSTSQTSTLRLTRHSDTISHDKNNYLWDTETASSSGVSNPYASTVDTYYKQKRNRRSKNSNNNNNNNNNSNGLNKVAPGLIPWAQKEDAYAQAQPATGFLFAKNKPDALPAPPTWTTLDPTTSKVNYEAGAQKPARTQKYSWDPTHKSNTPLAATFGTANVVYAPETALTAERLEKLDEHHEKRRKAQSVADYCEVAISPPSSPNIPPSEPSVILSAATQLSDTRSERSSLFIDGDDVIMTNANQDIDPDVRTNFMTNIDAMHDVLPALSDFEKRNKGIVSTNTGPITYINDFGDGRSEEFTQKGEDRTRRMDENMKYVKRDEGNVKKRFIRGFQEMIAKREAEMACASKEYREWKAMSPEARMERLSEIRQPIQLWNGKPGAADDDLYSVQDIPKFYKKELLKKLMRRQRMRALLADKAKAKNQKNGSQSARSVGTVDTRDTIGRLGDCDEVQTDTSAGSRTPHQRSKTDQQLQDLLVRALDDSQSRVTRMGTSSQSTPGNISPSHSIASTSSTTVETGFALQARLFAGGTGNSVAGPRQTRPNASPSSHSVQSQSPWSPMRAPSSVAGFSNGPRSTSGASHSTVKGQRKAPQSSKIAASQGTNIPVAYNELLAYDDSPLLQKPVDINIDLPALKGDALIQYNLAVENSVKRGRVVTVRLHTLPDGMPKFTPGAVADRVFGGLVQEFQLHPNKRTAVVVFLHSIEARAFIHHFRNVREKGTEQEIRELQIEASWYKGSEAESILPPQPNLLKHHLALSATRCIQLHRIPLGKTHKDIFAELGQRLGKLLLSMYLITPQQHYLQQSCGRRALIEFRSLADAIEAYQDLTSGMVQEYEDAEPEFVMEGTAKQSAEKAYCGCLGCEERRRHRELVKERKKKALEAEFAEASTKASARSESAMEVETEEDLMEFSSDSDSD